MHPWCRSTTIIGMNDKVLKGLQRRARDTETGKNYTVSGNTSYKDWFAEQEKKHGADKVDVFQKKVKNFNADRVLHEKYLSSSVQKYVPRDIQKFQDLKYNNSDEFTLLKDRKALYDRAIKKGKLPNYSIASTPQEKIQGYLLNSNHNHGKDKAKVFNNRLGYNYQNWEKLSDEIFREVAKCPADKYRVTNYGTRYDVPMVLSGLKGKSLKIKTVWQIDNGSNIPRIITATFYKKKKG